MIRFYLLFRCLMFISSLLLVFDAVLDGSMTKLLTQTTADKLDFNNNTKSNLRPVMAAKEDTGNVTTTQLPTPLPKQNHTTTKTPIIAPTSKPTALATPKPTALATPKPTTAPTPNPTAFQHQILQQLQHRTQQRL